MLKSVAPTESRSRCTRVPLFELGVDDKTPELPRKAAGSNCGLVMPNEFDVARSNGPDSHPTVGAENGKVTSDNNGVIEVKPLAADPAARNSDKDEGNVFDNGFADDDDDDDADDDVAVASAASSAENFCERLQRVDRCRCCHKPSLSISKSPVIDEVPASVPGHALSPSAAPPTCTLLELAALWWYCNVASKVSAAYLQGYSAWPVESIPESDNAAQHTKRTHTRMHIRRKAERDLQTNLTQAINFAQFRLLLPIG